MSSSETAGTTSQFCSREGCSNFRADDGPYCFTHRTREGGSSVGGEWQAGGEGALIGMLWTLGFVLVVVGFGVAESDNVLLGILIAGASSRSECASAW